uniref:Coiled-coil domain containing 120 n=1 Tax=Nothobranchius kadleci TaxID=1051664 RepID=A0A1A8CU61_NOTKA
MESPHHGGERSNHLSTWKQKERMLELQQRRRSLQALLSKRIAELRHICLQEAELTGAVPSDFPLEVGEKPPCIRRRGGTSNQGTRKCRAEEDESQRSKPKKTLFSCALRKYNCSEHVSHSHTHTHHNKRTVHRGCHTDDTVQSESSSTSDSTGHDNDDNASQCRPPLVSAGSPVFNQNKTWKKSVHIRSRNCETLQTQKFPQPPSHPPPPPPHSNNSCSSLSSPCEAEAGGEGGTSSEDQLISNPPLEDGGGVQREAGSQEQGSTRTFWSPETLTERWTRRNNKVPEGGGRVGSGGQAGGGRGGGYSEILLDYVWGKQWQRQQSQPNKQPITSQHQLPYNSCSTRQPPGAPPTYQSHHVNQCRVTTAKSCGLFLPVQKSQANSHHPAPDTIQPDPHPHLLPPQPSQLPPHQDSQLEEATRSLHKALALEGLRDWYLRNTLGSSHQTNGKVATGASTKVTAGVKGQTEGGEALQRSLTSHSISANQRESSHQYASPHPKKTLPHSATFHGHLLHSRSVEKSFYQDMCRSQKQEVLLRDTQVNQPSPGTLV